MVSLGLTYNYTS